MTEPQKLSILIADDAGVMRMLLRTMLQRVVHAEVTEASDGTHALKLATEREFDMVFLDVNMPQMTGLSVLDALRKMPQYALRPVVLLTSLGQNGQREKGMALGASAYMLKPLRQMELVRVLRKLVPQALEQRDN